MADLMNIDNVISDITMGLMPIIDDDAVLKEVGQVLYMSLQNLTIYREETTLSADIDPTEEYVKQYLLALHLKGCTKGSITNFYHVIRSMLDYTNKSVLDIKYQDLKGYLAYGKIQRGWADSTYNNKLIAIRLFFNWLYEEDMIDDNPAKKLKETKVEKKMGPTLNQEQREEVRCACETELELALCDMLYSSGARISELVALDIADMDFVNMKAVVYGKGRKEREIYFTGQAKVHLQRYLESRTDNNPALFVSPYRANSRISDQTVRNILKKIKARDDDLEKVVLTPHVFRRTVGTDMINKGAPLELVAEKLGHVQLDTTKQCYAALAKETVHRAHKRYVG